MITKLVFQDEDGASVQVHPISGAAAAWSSLEKITGLGSPSPRSEVTDRARRHGQVNRTAFYSGRTLDVQGRLVVPYGGESSNVLDFLDDVKGLLALDTDVKVIFRRRGLTSDEFVTARVASPVELEYVPRNADVLTWAVQLLAGDPRMYTDVLQDESYDPAAVTALDGLEFPIVFPLVFGADVTAGLLEAVNGGNFITPPVITIRGPVTDPTVENTTSERSIVTAGLTLSTGDTIEIDVGERSVMFAGGSRPDFIDAGETLWWELEPGTNVIRMTGTGMVEGQTLLTVEWRDARI